MRARCAPFLATIAAIGFGTVASAGEPFELRRRIGSGDDPQRPESVRTIAVSSDGRLVAFAGEPETPTRRNVVEIRDVETGKTVHRFDDHEQPVRSVAFSPANDRLATATCDSEGKGSIRLFNLASQRLMREFPIGGLLVRFRERGRIVAVGYGKIVVLENSDAPSANATSDTVMPIVKDLSHDLTRVVGVSHRGAETLEVTGIPSEQSLATLAGSTSEPLAAVFSPDGQTVAASDPQRRTLLVWEVLTGRVVHVVDTGVPVTALAFVADGRAIVAGLADGRLQTWTLATAGDRGRVEAHDGTVTSIAVGPGGMIVSGGTDRTIAVWTFHQTPEPSSDDDPLSEEAVDAAWQALAAYEPRDAYAVFGQMHAAPDRWLPAMSAKAERHIVPLAGDDLDRRIADLDDADVRVREQATASLIRTGPAARTRLENALKNAVSPEVKARLRLVLGAGDRSPRFTPADLLRIRRLCGEAESIGGIDAVRLLQLVVEHPPEPSIAEDARAALKRLGE